MGDSIAGDRVTLKPASNGFTVAEQRRRFEWSRNAELQYWSGRIPTAPSFAEFCRVLPERDWPSSGQRRSYGILDEGGQLIGMVSCYGIDWEQRTGELGVYIGETDLWNRGYGTDAVLTLLAHLFTDLRFAIVSLTTYATNTRALKSYEKAGFRRISTRRRFRPAIGYYREVAMSVDRETFLALHPTHLQSQPSEPAPFAGSSVTS